MKKFIILMFIILLSTFVAANSNTYKIDNIKCFGQMLVQINNITGDTNYLLNKECVSFAPNNYGCNCDIIPEFSNNFSSNNSMNYTYISFRLQYFIKDLTGDDIEDQKSKRVETRTIELKTEKKFMVVIMGESIDAVSFIMWFIFIVLLAGVFIAVFFLVLFMNMNKIKRWLGVDEKKPMTFWEVVAAIFSRKNIERRTVVPERIQTIRVEKKTETTSSDYEDEVKKLMEGL